MFKMTQSFVRMRCLSYFWVKFKTMKNGYTSFIAFLFVLVLLLAGKPAAAQNYGDSLSIKAEAVVQATPAQITISWPGDANATNFIVYRKIIGGTTWGTALATLPSTATSYTDNTVSVNTLYDYKIQMTSATAVDRFGYLSSGIEVVANSDRGIAIVVIENSYIGNALFMDQITTYLEDLDRDGWYAKPIYVNAVDPVTTVKASILSVYNEDPAGTKLLVLLGNVPVPYSGNLNPDGHPEHQGAWPTDTYYAELNGTWTDASVNNPTSAYPPNQNVPGDGKFDQSYLPSDVELQVGRVDLSDLPAYPVSEEELLMRYLKKDHLYKTAAIMVGEQALIDDNFGAYSEGFGQNGYNNFSAMVGLSNIATADYFTEQSYSTSMTGTYLWSYGCGAGNFTGASGIGSSASFTTDSLSCIFTMLFGSYFGDWDNSNAFLRAPLGQGNTLTNCWAARPNWYFNHMAMGENIGYSTRLTQNNNALYVASNIGGLARMVSINLMGDPSLRLHYLPAPVNLSITENGNSNTLNWSAAGAEIGYNIYRRYADSTNYLKLNTTLVTATDFTDSNLPVDGLVYYYVKAVEMRTTPSGSYQNESLAAKDSAVSTVGIANEEVVEVNVYPNPAAHTITFTTPGNLAGSGFTVINVTGEVVLSGILASQVNTINISHLANGFYTIQFTAAPAQKAVFVKE
jgi:hypothetical protein